MVYARKVINHIIPLNDTDWNAFSSLFEKRTLRKGEYFALEGRHETQLGFLEEGVLRAFYRNNLGVESNKTFFVEGEFFSAYAALLSGDINKLNIQALTDCTIFTAHYPSVNELFLSHRMIETLSRLITEYLYIKKVNREAELLLLEAEERYRLFQERYPQVENLVPQYQIASYLGITPTHLSRIRAKKAFAS